MTDRLRFLLVLACFVLSGVAGLVYQSAWSQQFAFAFGTSELAVATVLAAYMGGLTAGAALAGRYLGRVRRPVRLYALLELGIAVAALAVPVALAGANRLLVAWLGGLEQLPAGGSLDTALYYLVAAFVILLLPTGLMGATLPLLARYCVRDEGEIGSRIGLLYTANTLGAAAGAWWAAFGLLPWLGLGRTVWVAVGLNVLVFVLALLLSRTAAGDLSPEEAEPVRQRFAGGGFVLAALFIAGFVAFTWEVLWTRLLSHLLGGSIYSFGTMLSTFLVGIALGAALAAKWASSRERARVGFAVAQAAVGVLSWGAFALADRLPAWIRSMELEPGTLMPAGTWLAVLLLLPGALAMGATFPFAVRWLTPAPALAGQASARAYAWNTLGAIVGAIGTGFFLLPWLEISGTATLAVAASLVVALVTFTLRPLSRPGVAVVAAGLLAAALWPPATPWEVLRLSPIEGVRAQGDLDYFATGRSATVMLLRQTSQWRLTTNGLPESAILPDGHRWGHFSVARWLSLLPIASRPEAKSVLVVGLGAGLTVEAVPPSVEEIHLIELEPEVIEANRHLAQERESDPLADPRLRVSVTDARGAMMLTEATYDVIVSQPSHPWTSGASHLFTREFFQLVRERLEPDGVFSQWMGVRYVDGELLRSLLATMLDVFPFVELYEPPPGGGLLFLASRQPIDMARGARQTLARRAEIWPRLGIRAEEDLLLARVLDVESVRRLAEGAPLTTDWRNLLQIGSPRVMVRPLEERVLGPVLAEYDDLLRAEEPAEVLDAVRRLVERGELKRARQVAGAQSEPSIRQVAAGMLHAAEGRSQQARRNFRAWLDHPDVGREALYGWVKLDRLLLVEGRAHPALVERIEGDAAASTLVDGWRALRLKRIAEVRQIEPELARLPENHPLFGAAQWLRVGWREEAGEALLAAEALPILDRALVFRRRPVDLLLRRARLAARAEKWSTMLASLEEVARGWGARPGVTRVGHARRLFALLPAHEAGSLRARSLKESLDLAAQRSDAAAAGSGSR